MRIVGVTACLSGVAHTYMAAELLEKKAKKAGHSITVETQGALGSENTLTAGVIADAEAVVIVADINIEGYERFENARVLRSTISAFLKDPSHVLDALEKLRIAPPGTKISL
ncbi:MULTISPECIES: PTS fructose transporter subunit IIB [Pseudovibrio]|uniref:PTS fructose transporter subunit IIB n=1 Tax=Stappiaceae TaxID=2821832 RepID=UPI00236733E8|nr:MULTISPECIES: PTS fructose transporter subunit IIB [Pseudovibrio]MDD7909840.1 fructose PTS transporter subunit IIB [Pseudovibrio exalbescens]MDX5592179.1 PTS fructose transporter subunit IIB [Pseudovibrio sp. SPO723]